MHLEFQIDKQRLPKHLAIIMDGNGRWAKKRGMPRSFGHKNGITPVRETIETCGNLGIQYLTLYAFSSDNWNRPKKEVNALMKLLVRTLKKEINSLCKHNISLRAIGEIKNLPDDIQILLQEIISKTKDHANILTIALSYGAKEEITRAVKFISEKVKNNQLNLSDIDQQTISKHLFTHDLPEVDLLIRTSGEFRISNFLLWQIAYAELHFTNTLWPDFRKDHLYEALLSYQNRERRFGKTAEQITKKTI